jgi:hypothetical protein
LARIRICSGQGCSLWWARGSSDRFRGKDYFDKLKPPEKAKFEALFERMARDGRIPNIELFRKESDEIYCFKRYQDRLACFQQGTDWLIVHGFRKKRDKDKRSKRHIETAERIRTRYLDRTRGSD